jgi:hypothetical protein
VLFGVLDKRSRGKYEDKITRFSSFLDSRVRVEVQISARESVQIVTLDEAYSDAIVHNTVEVRAFVNERSQSLKALQSKPDLRPKSVTPLRSQIGPF